MATSIKKTAFLITFLTIISKIIGFGREMMMANYFGASVVTDAYQMSLSIPFIIYGGILTTIGTSFMPIYSSIKENKNNNEANKFTNNLVNLTIVLGAISSIVCIIFARQIVSIMASGFTGEVFDITVEFVRISCVSALFASIYFILIPYVRYNENYTIEQVSGLFSNTILIITVILSGIYSYKFLMYGMLISHIIRLIVVAYVATKKDYKYQLYLNIKEKEIIEVIKFTIPLFISNAAWQINGIIDKAIASRLSEGSISALNYASIIKEFANSLFTVAIFTIIYPILSKQKAKEDMKNFKNTLETSINYILIILIPLTIGIIILSKPTVKLIYERGQFDTYDTAITSSALIFYSIGLTGQGLKVIYTKALYTLKDSKGPMIVGLLTVLLNIVFNLILVKRMGHNGLALATSISSLITVVPLILIARKKIGNVHLLNKLLIFIKVIFASLIMTIVINFIYNKLSNIIGFGFIKELITLGITITTGGSIYILILYSLKVYEIKTLVNSIREKLFRNTKFFK